MWFDCQSSQVIMLIEPRGGLHCLFWILNWTSVLMLMAAVVTDVDSVYAPYVVAVLKREVLSCSGALLSKKYVAVACHCIAALDQPGRPRLNGLELKDYDFVAGESDPRMLRAAQYKRKPKALLTHPYCENEPPIVYDVGVAVMEDFFPTIHDVIEIYDSLSTNSEEFRATLTKMFSWKRPEEAPNCTYAGWKFFSTPEKNQLVALDMISMSTTECRGKWQKEDPKDHPPKFNFNYPEQFCMVTRNTSQDGMYLPNDGPLVCDRGSGYLYVGLVSYGPELRMKTREVPIVTQSLSVLVEWMLYDTYFESIGCFGRDADNCHIEDQLNPIIFEFSLAAKNTIGSCSLIIFVNSLSQFKN